MSFCHFLTSAPFLLDLLHFSDVLFFFLLDFKDVCRKKDKRNNVSGIFRINWDTEEWAQVERSNTRPAHGTKSSQRLSDLKVSSRSVTCDVTVTWSTAGRGVKPQQGSNKDFFLGGVKHLPKILLFIWKPTDHTNGVTKWKNKNQLHQWKVDILSHSSQ